MKQALLVAIICMSLVTTGMALAFDNHNHDFQRSADHHHDANGDRVHHAKHQHAHCNEIADSNSTDKQSDIDIKADNNHYHGHGHSQDAFVPYYSVSDLSNIAVRSPMWVTDPLLLPADPVEDNLRPPSRA